MSATAIITGSCAASIADALRVEWHAVHAVPPSAYPLGVPAGYRKRLDQRMQSRMRQLTRKAEVDVKAVHVAHGKVEQSSPDLARKIPGQILAMGIISRR